MQFAAVIAHNMFDQNIYNSSSMYLAHVYWEKFSLAKVSGKMLTICLLNCISYGYIQTETPNSYMIKEDSKVYFFLK